MPLYYLMLWNQVDILQKHFRNDHAICTSKRGFLRYVNLATETSIHRRSPISFCYAMYRWMRIERGPKGKRTIWKYERSPRTCLGPQDVFPCPWNPLYSNSARRHMESNWRSHHGNASLRAADSLMTILDIFFTLSKAFGSHLSDHSLEELHK